MDQFRNIFMAVERWLLVALLRYPPEFAGAVVAAHQARQEYGRLLGSFAQERLKLERARDELRSMIERMAWEVAQIRATKERLIAKSQQGAQSHWSQVWTQDAISNLQRREHEIVEQINRGSAIDGEIRAAAAKLDLSEAYARIVGGPMLH